MGVELGNSRCSRRIQVATRNRIIAATGFEGLPAEPRPRGSSELLAPYSPSTGGQKAPARDRRSRWQRPPVAARAPSPAAGERCPGLRRRRSRPARPPGRAHRDRPEPQERVARRRSLPSLRRSAARSISGPAHAANQPPARRWRHCRQPAPGRPRPPGSNVARCTRARRGWWRSAASTAPCFPASAPPRRWGSHARRG